MKTIKYLFWLIILTFLGILIYQNVDYFMTKSALSLDLKVKDWSWTVPELANIFYFGICFLLGVILFSIKSFIISYRLGKVIKARDSEIDSLKERMNKLRTDLEVFQHDPYIQKQREEAEKPAEEAVIELPVPEEKKGDDTGSTD
jgi:hypothetical protein